MNHEATVVSTDLAPGEPTYGQFDLLVLSGETVIVVQLKASLGLPVAHQLPLEAEQYSEVALAADYPDGILGRLHVGSNLAHNVQINRV